MASKLLQLQSKVVQASNFVTKHGCTYYKQMMEKNQHYVQSPPTIEKCNELSKQLLYTRLARNHQLATCSDGICERPVIFGEWN